MKSLFLSQRMAGLPSGLSEKDLNVQVSLAVTFRWESAQERFVSLHALEAPATFSISDPATFLDFFVIFSG